MAEELKDGILGGKDWVRVGESRPCNNLSGLFRPIYSLTAPRTGQKYLRMSNN